MAFDYSKYINNPGPKKPARGKRAAVTTDNAIVTETMIKILKKGGNAADATIAGAIVQAAVEPFMTNHAGLVTCLYYDAKSGEVYQLDSLGAFPSGLSPVKPVPGSTGGYSNPMIQPSCIIPGFMPGVKALHERFGSLDWASLCEDGIAWAERGHMISTHEYGVNTYAEKFITYFPEGREFFMPDGYLQNVGEIFVPKGLAETLRGVADHGPDYMITGPWAESFVAKANEMGWKITLDHMTETPPRWSDPLRFAHRDHEVLTLGPPQAQGFFTAVTLGVAKHLGIAEMEHGSADHIWVMGQALRQGARHWEYAQDETIYGVPSDAVLDDGYHAHLARLIAGTRPKVDLSGHIALGGGLGGAMEMMSAFFGAAGKPRTANVTNDQPSGSCEIACVDADGNWIQFMDTLQGSGIPGMVIGGVPMVGSHATFGNLQSPMDATLVKGAKGRCIIGNSMVLKDGKPAYSAGSPGNIHCTLPQVLSNILDLGMDVQAAVEAPRMLPMSEARGIVIEDRITPKAVGELHRIGVNVAVVPGYDIHMGSFSVIGRENDGNTYTATADPRRCAVADGY